MKRIAILSLFIAVISGCSAVNNNSSFGKGVLKITGVIEKPGVTTYQYGTHVLKAEDKTYAIQSESIDFDSYLNRKVEITGRKVSGYPVDGGPELIRVTLIKY